jgi:hypothetical protein
MASNYQGFVGNLNELVQDYFNTTQLSYDPAAFSAYTDKWSYIYASLIKTKGPDMIKLSNLQNFLSEWDRPYSYGGFIRSVSVGPVRPFDPPTFANGSVPNNGQIRKADVQATYHPFKIRCQFMITQFADQLKEAMSVPEEIGLFLAAVLQSLSDGANDTLFRLYKEIIFNYFTTLPTATQAALTVTGIPATITDKATAIQAINLIRNYKTDFMFGKEDYNSVGFKHTVLPERQRLYLTTDFANALVDFLKLDHFMGDVNYADIPGSLSNFLGIPVRILDDFGGLVPYSGPIDAANRLFPIFDADGAVTGTYAATAGGTTPVDVVNWGQRADYAFRAILTEDDFGNVFPVNDNIQTQQFILGGGYTNTARYIERLCVAKPQSNTLFFK